MDHEPVGSPRAGLHGVIVLDKPAGMSSAAAVEKVKRALAVARAGHGGTLDPIATGVLPIAVGAGTKLAGFLLSDDKAYEAEIELGAATSTLDRTGIVTERAAWEHVTEAAVLAALAARIGEQDQVPPMHSAIKVDGIRLYRRARLGEQIERAPRRIRIDSLELIAFAPPRLNIAIACGKGTYVRSLVADLAADLGTVGHLAELRRTRAGRFAIDQVVALADVTPELAATRLIPVEQLSGLPRITAQTAELVRLVLHAVPIELARLGVDPAATAGVQFQLADSAGALLAIAHTDPAGVMAYDRVFPELHRKP